MRYFNQYSFLCSRSLKLKKKENKENITKTRCEEIAEDVSKKGSLGQTSGESLITISEISMLVPRFYKSKEENIKQIFINNS